MLENAVCPFKIYRHGASQVSTKNRDLAIFWWDRQYFLLDYQAKSWMIGRYKRQNRWPHIIHCSEVPLYYVAIWIGMVSYHHVQV